MAPPSSAVVSTGLQIIAAWIIAAVILTLLICWTIQKLKGR